VNIVDAGPAAATMSKRARGLSTSSLIELFLLARERDAIDLAVGSPGYPCTPPPLLDAAVEALRAGHNQYEIPAGDAALRRHIAATFAAPTDPDTQITVTVGGTEALCVALLTSIDPGDEVIVLEPFYENFLSAIALAGGVPRVVALRPPDWTWDPADLAAAFGPRTRAIMVNTPANPTGRVLDRAELDEIATLCSRWGVTVISDEVYSGLLFDDRTHVSVADVEALDPYSIVIGSLSKGAAVSGWRLGYLRADPARTAVLRRVHETTTNGTGAPLQRAAGAVGLPGAPWWRPAPGLAERRNVAQRILHDMGLTFRPADGGCFLLADISGVTSEDSTTYVRCLLAERNVLLVPGGGFFADRARGRAYVRMAFNRPMETLDAAARALVGPPPVPRSTP
jgi:aminotransferase